MDHVDIIDLLFDNLKPLFFPENWLQLDLKFSKSEIFSTLLIDKRHEITMTELAEYIGAPMSTANGVIERLVKKGYVIRDRSDTDRRIVVVRLTENGTQLISGFKELISGYLKLALEALTPEEVQTLIGIVMKVVRSMQEKLGGKAEQEAPQVKKIAID